MDNAQLYFFLSELLELIETGDEVSMITAKDMLKVKMFEVNEEILKYEEAMAE